MLVLSRKINETVIIGGNIRLTMTSVRNRQVRIAIEAPPDVKVMREELLPESAERRTERSLVPGSMSRADRYDPRRARGARLSR
jgi:carbon storage regulator